MKSPKSSRIPLSEDQFTNTDIARFYDEHARRFMGIIYRRFVDSIEKHNLTGQRVLDIGTGTGIVTILLAKKHPEWQITGIDISEEMLEIARENAARNNVFDSVTFQKASAEALPFSDGSFNLVVSNASLHLWKDPIKVFNEIVRVTAPGGYCLIWDNMRLTPISPFLSLTGHMMGMNKDQCQLWLKARQSAYSPNEAKALLSQSAMNNARVKVVLRLLELKIEWKKP